MSDYKDRNDVARAGGVTGKRDLITGSSMLRWLAEGKIISAGLGCEETAIDSAAALADVSPTFGIFAPSNSDIKILPIYARMSMTGEGGAAPVIQAAFTKAAANCATAMTRSGTALSKQNNNAAYIGVGDVVALHTVTVSALTTADYLSMVEATVVDNSISVAGANLVNTHVDFDFLKAPILLSAGAGLLFYAYTGTTDSTWIPYIVWAQLTADDLY
uniref:Tail protein n=1 Tax=viral metagenome TaxID=1070528 RepID=A0A6M3J2X7_9ZZZZ